MRRALPRPRPKVMGIAASASRTVVFIVRVSMRVVVLAIVIEGGVAMAVVMAAH